MANISTYPIGTPAASDLIPGTQLYTDTNGKTQNLTRNFSVSSIATFATENYVEVTKTLSNAEWLALPTTSVVLITAQGAGTAIKILTATLKFNHVSTSFFFNNSLIIGTGASGSVSSTNQCVLPTAFEDIDSNEVISLATQNANISLNAPIYIGTPNGSVNSGDGTVTVVLRYQVI